MIDPSEIPLVGLIILLVLLAYVVGTVIWNKIHNKITRLNNDKGQDR